MRAVVKVGTSSLTDAHGAVDLGAMSSVARQVAAARSDGHELVLVSSGAIAAGLPALGLSARDRPRDARTLQAVSAVGQALLMQEWRTAFAPAEVVVGQVLVASHDFVSRAQYLHARSTLDRLLEMGVVPVVNENDAVADDEIRYGDNDRIAALVAQLLSADLLVLLTDAAGLYTADPRFHSDASLIEEIVAVDAELEAMAGGPGSSRGSGGMATKLAAARIAAWSGVRTVIAAADRPDVIAEALAGHGGVGTTVHPRGTRLAARKVWIAFAVGSAGRLVVDDGARRALERRGASLLAAGLMTVDGDFGPEAAVEVADAGGEVFAKGLVRRSSSELRAGEDLSGVVIHRDDLVVLG